MNTLPPTITLNEHLQRVSPSYSRSAINMHVFVVVLVLIQRFGLISCETYHIVPSEHHYCSGSCLTLSQYGNISTGDLNSSTTMFFTGGNHHLDTIISISDVVQFSLLAINDTDFVFHTNISCSEHAAFLFSNITNQVYISGLTFIGCSGFKIEFVNQFSITNSRFLGRNNSKSSLLIVGSVGNITKTSFISNKFGISKPCFFTILSCPQLIVPSLGGAMRVIHSNLTVDMCLFQENGANSGGAIYSEVESIISINNSVFTSNSATGCYNKPCSSFGGVFVVNESSTLFVHGSSFTNNTSDQDGGVAVVVNSTFIVTHSNLSQSTADSNGGAVAAFQNSNIVFDTSTISYGRVKSDGGVLYLKESAVTVRQCDIFSNMANKRGGVIASHASNSVILHSSSFSNNSAQVGGVISTQECNHTAIENCDMSQNIAHINGSVVCSEFTSTITINNNTLENNIAASHGGLFYLNSVSSIDVIGCNIQCNRANGSGGVIYAKSVTSLEMNDNDFSYNEARSSGGVVFLVENSAAVINNSMFAHSKAGSGGGVISVRESLSSVIFSECTFNFNEAVGYGGVAHLQRGSSISVSDSVFYRNTAGRRGGVINGYSLTSITVIRTRFLKNKSIVGGGAVSLMLGGSFFAKDSVFHHNVGSDLGAVIHVINETNVTIHNCNITENSANLGGVLFAIRKHTITIMNSTFINNTAKINGGTLYTRTQCEISISYSTFINNIAIGDGVILVSDQSNITLLSSIFMKNRAEHDGGVAYVYNNCYLIMKNCSVATNNASNSGGVVYGLKSSNISISQSRVLTNRALYSGGGFHIQQESSINIANCTLIGNTADYGGVLRITAWSSAFVLNSVLNENRAGVAGGATAAYKSSNITLEGCNLTSNTANFGGATYLLQTNYLVNGSITVEFIDFDGITRVFQKSTLIVTGSNFQNNMAEYGGAMYTKSGQITIQSCSFSTNRARYAGGCIYASDISTVDVTKATFTDNIAGNDGGVIALIGSSSIHLLYLRFMNNRAERDGGVIALTQSSANICNVEFRISNADHNGGVISIVNGTVEIESSLFFNSNVTNNGGVVNALMKSRLIILHSNFISNAATHSGGVLHLAYLSRCAILNSTFEQNEVQENGGAISTLSESEVNITGSIFNNNTAKLGAAFAAVQKSCISFVSSPIGSLLTSKSQINQIHGNVALSGGGVYLSGSCLNFETETSISNNYANESGGGVYADMSSIMVKGTVYFESNIATNGGGISLKNSTLLDNVNEVGVFIVLFTSNQAYYGGALYVDDLAQNHLCSSDPLIGDALRGCFFGNVTTDRIIFSFNNNHANISGHNLYGGLLDRCSVVGIRNMDLSSGAARLDQISNIHSFDTVSSEPVRVCRCTNNKPNCSNQMYPPIRVKYRNGFSFSVAAVDQVNNTVPATIYSYFKDLAVSTSQSVQRIDGNCSRLEYYVSFPEALKEYHLNVYAQGPCSDKSISKLNVIIYVDSCLCPPGLVSADRITKCDCICDNRFSTFSKYIQECNASTGTVTKIGLFWITYLHDVDYNNLTHDQNPYFIHPYCPVDYCHPPSMSIQIDLKQPNGSDAQCANNRRGILCGSCSPYYSLSLGSSKCIKCPDNWYGHLVGIIVAAFFAGILLVLLLLVFNVTVAVGTLNSIIFYANIINANRITYFSQPNLTFVPVFISWLNLDIGFDTCFFEGMDIYAKTWIQLAFPTYIIILVIAIIWVSSCSSRFSNLIGKRNPVATLATLILLSYTRVLQSIIASFSFVNLNYPNGTTILTWLPNANFRFVDNKLKLALLICVAICILFVGLSYTIIITSWQLLIRYSRKKIFSWTRNHKIYSFVDTYHTPYTAKHRYWTGLLLLVRVIVYLIAAFSAPSEQPITLLSTTIIMCCLLLYKNLWTLRVYKNSLLNALESFMFFNIAVFAVCTLYKFNSSGYEDKEVLFILQRFVAYVCVGSTLLLLVLIIIFHICRYGSTKMYSLLHPNANPKSISTTHDNQLLHDHLFATSENIILDAIDSPRTMHATPFIQFKNDTY